PLGGLLDTSSVGTHSFSVHAVDYAGAETTVTHTYTVFDTNPPTATIAPATRASSAASVRTRTATRSRPAGPGPSHSRSTPSTRPETTAAPASPTGLSTKTRRRSRSPRLQTARPTSWEARSRRPMR